MHCLKKSSEMKTYLRFFLKSNHESKNFKDCISRICYSLTILYLGRFFTAFFVRYFLEMCFHTQRMLDHRVFPLKRKETNKKKNL